MLDDRREAPFPYLKAAAPAKAMASSTCGVSPLTPMAPMTLPSSRIGIPPWSGVLSARASVATRPARICSSKSRLGRQ